MPPTAIVPIAIVGSRVHLAAMRNIESKQDASGRVIGDDDPIEIPNVHESAPWWPYGIDGTYRLVRRGELRAIAIGRRRYVTVALLRDCLARHTRVAELSSSAHGAR